MNKPVLTSSGCKTCAGGTGLTIEQSAAESIIVRSAPGINIGNIINEYEENGKKVYELDDLVETGPTATLTNNAPAVTEVGVNIALVTFNGTIVAGTSPIVSRVLFPDEAVDLNVSPFSFNKANVKRSSPGVANLHTLTVIDSEGNEVEVSSGVTFKAAFYQGFSDLATLTATQIKALVNKTLNDTIIQQYGGAKNYVVPNGTPVPKYIYWAGPVGTQAIAAASLNGLTLPLVDLAPVNIINDHDALITTSYWVKRTANRLDPGTYSISLS